MGVGLRVSHSKLENVRVGNLKMWPLGRRSAMEPIGNRNGIRRVLAGRGLAALVLGAALAAQVLWAQGAAPGTQAARLSSVDGQVQVSLGGQVLAEPAVANTPLFEGSVVITHDDGQAEIQFEDGSVARISPNSALELTVLRGQGGSGDAEIVLENGLGYFELQGGGQGGKTRVEFGDSVVTASGFTVLRVNLDSPPGELAVFSGNAHLDRGSALALDLHGGESVALSGKDLGRYDLSESIEPDSWDAWNADRDQELNTEASTGTGVTKTFADNSNPAWSDLDANGNWYNVPDQGYIWSPYDASSPGWDPYGSGYWMWTPRFGYMWVSGYGWGYMPFQCGMWNYYTDFGWGWAPGMGGCSPWWGMGYYGGPNIGIGYGGYRPPAPPRRVPIRSGLNSGNDTGNRPHPLVPVNRRPLAGAADLPARDRTTPVVIAGHTVQAQRPLNPRPQYDRSAAGYGNHPAAGYTVTGQGPRTAGGSGPIGGSGSGASRPASSPPPRSSGSGSSHPSSSPRPSSSGGGGGGGAPHVSSGGGGGGGGGAPAGSHR